MDNKQISDILSDACRIMELHGVNDFKVKSIKNAAFQISRLETPVVSISRSDLEEQKGIGKSIAEKILEIIQTGSVSESEKLMQNTPPGVLQIMQIKGIGPKKTAVIWKELGIESIGELLYSCNENRLVELKGFGKKTQDQIKSALEFTLANQGLYHYAALEELEASIHDSLTRFDFVSEASITGEFRRKIEVTGKLEFVLAASVSAVVVAEKLRLDPLFNDQELKVDNQTIFLRTNSGVPVEIHVTDANRFCSLLLITTGNDKHLQEVGIDHIAILNQNYRSEHDFYSSNGMQFIEPELREGFGESDLARKHMIPELIRLEDLKGCLHNHSTYSDGQHTIEEMATACRNMGLEYFGICDHSKSAFYANGLDEERVKRQQAEVDQLNRTYTAFRIFKGIESDILSDGSLDYSPDVLASFDFVVASVHSNLKMDEAKATARIIKAVSNPFTTILGHPTGRLLLARKGYPINHREIIDACSHYGVVIELNAHPFRLDLDWRWIRYALEKKVMISINPDAHEAAGLTDMKYGVCVARKGMLTSSMTFNARNLSEISEYFNARKLQALSTF
jgi:DNA polymerase (family 10)